MRILQAGNANFGYVMARELRKKGFEVDLLIPKQMIAGTITQINDPLNYDKDLEYYPEWVYDYDRNKTSKIFHIIRLMRKYDLIHAYNTLPIHAMLSGKPYLAQSGGDDLRKTAFRKTTQGFFLKTAYKKANQFVYVWPIHKPYVERLGIKNAIFLPRIWDTKNFIRKNVKEDGKKSLTIFFPTMEDWGIKGNDKFLKAFVKLCKEDCDVFLYYVDWGKDSEKAKELLNLPKVKEKTKIIQGPISRKEMTHYMEKSDIIADQFNSGSFTRLGIESFIFGIPLLINLDENLHANLHGEAPPIINGKNEEEIYSKLKELVHSSEVLDEIGRKAHEWGIKHFDLKKNIEKYIQIYENILKK